MGEMNDPVLDPSRSNTVPHRRTRVHVSQGWSSLLIGSGPASPTMAGTQTAQKVKYPVQSC